MRSRARRVDPMIRRLTRAFATVLTVCGLVAAPLAAGAAHTAAHAAGAAPNEGSADTGVHLSVAVDGAGVARPGQDVVVTATITNEGTSVVPGGDVTLWIDDSGLDSRAELTAWLDSSSEDARARALGSGPAARLEPGATESVQIIVPAASVGLDGNTTTAVFGIGATLPAPDGSALVDHGSVVWYPGGATPTTNVAVAVPISTPAMSDGLISAKDLETYTSPNGLLSRQLDGLFGYPNVAIGLDPRILASIRVLGSAAPPSANTWLQKLLALPNDVFPLQYADADAAGQVQSGLTKLLSPTSLAWAMKPSDFTGARDRVGQTQQPGQSGQPQQPDESGAPAAGDETATPAPTSTPTSTPSSGPKLPSVKKLLSWPYTLTGIAWPPDDTVRGADLPVFVANGLTTTILSAGNTTAAALKSTPNAAVKVPAGKAVASDAAVSAALRDAVTAGSDSDWNAAMSRVNAQLELIGQEKGSGPRTILATLDRGWPTDPTMLPRTLQELEAAPWETSVTLPQAVHSAVTAGLTVKDEPEAPARIATIQQLRADEAKLAAFSTVLDDPATMTGPTRVRLLSLLGASWLSGNDWDAATAKSIAATVKTLQSITIVPASNVNVASTEAPIPITVENALDKAVTIVLSATPSNGRLEIDGTTTKTLQPDSRGTVIVPVKATLGNGHVRLLLALHSPTGVPIGDRAVLPVQVHADWEGVGALVIGILVVLLFGFGIVRNILRHRSERGAPARTPSAEGDPRG